MATLYLMLPQGPAADGRGLFWPDPGGDPINTELVAWEQEMDEWNGDEIVAAVDAWFLATAALCEAISSAGLTGLRVGVSANVSYSGSGKVLAPLGELAAKELPEFQIVVPEHAIDMRVVDGYNQGIGLGDDLRYEAWAGEDFSFSKWGAVLTERALAMVRSHRLSACQFWPVAPR